MPDAAHLTGLPSWCSDEPKCEKEESVLLGERKAHLFFRTDGKIGLGTSKQSETCSFGVFLSASRYSSLWIRFELILGLLTFASMKCGTLSIISSSRLIAGLFFSVRWQHRTLLFSWCQCWILHISLKLQLKGTELAKCLLVFFGKWNTYVYFCVCEKLPK